jgi:hypothetical protein
MPQPDAVVLAACWLVDPDDWIGDGRPLPDRIADAIAILQAPKSDRRIQEKVAHVLENGIPKLPKTVSVDETIQLADRQGYWAANYVRRGAATRLAVAKALGTVSYPDLALPILDSLFHLAMEMGQAWASSDHHFTEFHCECQELLCEIGRSIASLEPFTARSAALLETILITANESSGAAHGALNPRFVYDEILPRLADRSVEPDAVPLLLAQTWRNHCVAHEHAWVFTITRGESDHRVWPPGVFVRQCPNPMANKPSWAGTKIHRYFHVSDPEAYNASGMVLLCALQALARFTGLSAHQQEVVWWVYRTSWNALIKSLCLLILGRQRGDPSHGAIAGKMVRELVRVVRLNPMTSLAKVMTTHTVRSPLFRLIHGYAPPDPDFNYAYLCQATAVRLIGELLQHYGEDPTVCGFRPALERALLTATSMFRWGMEPHLSGYTSLGSETSRAKGLIRLIATTQEEEDEMAWLARPADLAYQVISATSLLR